VKDTAIDIEMNEINARNYFAYHLSRLQCKSCRVVQNVRHRGVVWCVEEEVSNGLPVELR
jgi:hypothetical protein